MPSIGKEIPEIVIEISGLFNSLFVVSVFLRHSLYMAELRAYGEFKSEHYNIRCSFRMFIQHNNTQTHQISLTFSFQNSLIVTLKQTYTV